MPRIIERQQGILETPSKSIGARVSAKFKLSQEAVNLLGIHAIRRAVTAELTDVHAAISNSVFRAYARSGLRVISGALLNTATRNFGVDIIVRAGGVIIIDATWFDPQIPYFFYQLFGWPKGKARKDGRTWGHKPRGFIKFDGQARNQISGIMRSAIKAMLEAKKGKKKTERKKAPKGRRAGKAQEVARKQRKAIQRGRQAPAAKGRIMPIRSHKARKALRLAGLSFAQARRELEAIQSRGFIVTHVDIDKLIAGLKTGRTLRVVTQPRYEIG